MVPPTAAEAEHRPRLGIRRILNLGHIRNPSKINVKKAI
jgi:hypothetical protein